VQAGYQLEAHVMSVIQSAYALPTRWGLLGVLCSALIALFLFNPSVSSAQEAKQIKLTEKQVQDFIAVAGSMAQLYDNVRPDKPDPKVDAQADTLVKKHGFASLREYDDVETNIAMILSGIDPQTKRFMEPPDQIKQQIDAVRSDKSVPEAQKKEELVELEAVLKDAKPIQFRENIALVLKHFDELAGFTQGQRPAD
jgi:hypothetical protein